KVDAKPRRIAGKCAACPRSHDRSRLRAPRLHAPPRPTVAVREVRVHIAAARLARKATARAGRPDWVLAGGHVSYRADNFSSTLAGPPLRRWTNGAGASAHSTVLRKDAATGQAGHACMA